MHVCYALAFNFPNSSAATRRVVGIANLLVACGHEVTIISSSDGYGGTEAVGLSSKVDLLFAGGRSPSGDVEGGFIGKLFFGSHLVQAIRSMDRLVDVVLVYGGYTPLLLRLMFEKKNSSFALVFDAVEWASLRSDWWRSAYLISVELAMRFLVPRLDGVVCISSFLKDHYEYRVPVALIPPLPPELKEIRDLRNPKGKRKFLYMGNSDYDNVDVLVECFARLVDHNDCVELHVAGAFLGASAFKPSVARELRGRNIFFHGLLSQDEAQSLLSDSDALIFLRDDSLITRAGFPTKFVQALCSGVPVITSAASDIEKYMSDGSAGIILQDLSIDSVLQGISQFAAMSDADIIEMKNAALQVGRVQFDSVRYIPETNKFLRLCNETRGF